MRIAIILALCFSVSFAKLYYYKGGKKIIIYPIKEVDTRQANTPKKIRVIDNNNHEMLMTNEVLLRLKAGTLITDLEKNFNATYIKHITKNILLFRLPSAMQALDFANAINEQGLVIYAHPNMIFEHKKR